MLDKATVLTTIFTIVDDVMKGSPAIRQALKRPGRQPRLSDSEVVTLALYQELIGEPREDHFFRLHRADLLPYFPRLNERSRYNRRKRDLWSAILAFRLSLQLVTDSLCLSETAVVDSAPLPCVGQKRSKSHSDFVGSAGYGFCSSKALRYFGYKLHTVVGLTGVVMGFLLTSGSPHDSRPVGELLDSMPHHLRALIGDKAYTNAKLAEQLKRYHGLQLLAPAKANRWSDEKPRPERQLNRLRLICETVNGQLQEQFHLSQHYAKSVWGLLARVAAKLAAHSVGMAVNLSLGLPVLRLAALAV